MKVLDRDGLDQLKDAVRVFAAGLASSRWDTADHVNGLLAGHRLGSSDLAGYLKDQRPSR